MISITGDGDEGQMKKKRVNLFVHPLSKNAKRFYFETSTRLVIVSPLI